jgi:hypothetical protein
MDACDGYHSKAQNGRQTHERMTGMQMGMAVVIQKAGKTA